MTTLILIQAGQTLRMSCQIHPEAGMPLREIGLDEAPREFEFVMGEGQAPLPGLEAVLDGASVQIGQSWQVEIPPERAFGVHRPELVFEAVRDNLPGHVNLTPGMPLYTSGEKGVFQLKVVKLTENGAMLDGNHPLAGYPLRLTLTIHDVEARRPAPRRFAVKSSLAQ